jgi:uncharacterized protein YqeY
MTAITGNTGRESTVGMSLKEQLRVETTAGMKAGDKIKVGSLRMLSAAITNREKEVLHELSDDEVREIAGKEVKKRTESIEAFEAAGRTELVAKERAERAILEPYAPTQLDAAMVDALIDEAFAATGATGPQDIGKVMGFVMGRAKGQVDGTLVQQKVSARLGSVRSARS